MPFIFAHPLAVLPFLNRKYFSATGLIVGSITPDFESFMRMRSFSEHSHSVAGLLYFDLPLGFLLAWFFHKIMKDILLDNSPAFVQQRLVPLRHLNFASNVKRNFWIFTSSVLIGSATHLLWDSFTHGGAFMSSLIPFIHEKVVSFQGARYPMWYVLQHISSVMGLFGVILYFLGQKKQVFSQASPSVVFWPLVFSLTFLVFYLRYQLGSQMNEGNTVVALVAAFIVGLTVSCSCFKISKHLRSLT
jgi:hypothetical protein